MISPEKVAAIVTTFHPSAAIVRNLERIAKQVLIVIVVDDTGTGTPIPELVNAGIGNVVLLRNEKNVGIAAALNSGVRHAAQLGCDWVVTFDDDTLISETYVDDIAAFAGAWGCGRPLGVIACSRVPHLTSSKGHGGYKFKRTLITSGSMFSIDTYRKVGGFDETFFIDLVDFDFCLRIRRLGLEVVQLDKPGMDHKVGNIKLISVFGKKFIAYNHSPFRLYYQTRNVFLFLRKHFRFDPWLSLYLLGDVFRVPLRVIFFEQDKKLRFRHVFFGIKDGFLNRGGRLVQ